MVLQLETTAYPAGEGNGNPLQYSCMEIPMDGGAWWATVHGVARSRTQLSFWLHFHFSLSCIGEGNGNPLQCSCLENPWDGEAWWAAVYGVAQSRTQLKQLSSSSSIHKITSPPISWASLNLMRGEYIPLIIKEESMNIKGLCQKNTINEL